ncbi:hypothetical protein [Bacillus sp. C1]
MSNRMEADSLAKLIMQKTARKTQSPFLVGRVVELIDSNYSKSTVLVNFEYFGDSNKPVSCKLSQRARKNLQDKPQGSKVLIGKFSDLYVVLDIIL